MADEPVTDRPTTDPPGSRSKGIAGGVATVVGAWRAGGRAGDDVVRERTKFLSGWAKFGLAGLVIAALFARQDADRREARDERTAERQARAERDVRLASAFDKLASAIDHLGEKTDDEAASCSALRTEISAAFGTRFGVVVKPAPKKEGRR